ncbi:MAG: thiolase family protein [Betaproteobacteria bacterium]|nr:thiolase family protein [Betaproteobacteria bacterium]
MDTGLRNRVAIVGVGESDIGKVPHMTGLGLNAQAARRALDDAGLKVSDIDGLLTAYSFTEPYFMLGTVLCEYLGLKPRYCSALIAGGASPAVMLGHAAAAIALGLANTVLVCTGENRATGLSRDDAVSALAAAVGHPYFEFPYGPSIPGCYALITRRYMHEYGITREQLAQVSVTTRRHACLHPNSHMKKPITVAEVIQSKPIADPLNILDCCLISDAAGAFIVTSAERARDCKARPAYLLGVGERHTHEHILCAESLVHFGATDSSSAAYRMAGLGPEDIDVAELYDCFSIVPIIELEELGFCKAGEGGAFYAAGHAEIGGRLPINTHGGMLSHAHAGATGGLLGIIEAVAQLRGGLGPRQVEGAEVALVHNEGGVLSSHCTVILASEQR